MSQITTLGIAEKIGRSHSTVSNVLGGKHGHRYSERTQKEILDAAKQLGYHSNVSRRLNKKPLKHIGFLTGGIAGLDVPFVKEMLSGLNRVALEERTFLTVIEQPSIDAKDRSDIEQKAKEAAENSIGLVSSKTIDGVIIDKSRFGTPQVDILHKAGVPFVLINGRIPGQYRGKEQEEPVFIKTSYWTTIDYFLGGQKAAEYLLKFGHRRFAILNPATFDYPIGYWPAVFVSALVGFKQSIENAGVDINPKLIKEKVLYSDRNAILSFVEQLMSLAEPPTAIFVTDDNAASFIMCHLHSKGIKIPEDVSIIGLGNLRSVMTSPKLTTVDIPWAQMGERGLRMLLSLLNNGEVARVRTHHVDILEPEIVEGETVASPKRR